ncbi:MAG: hypothetical protein HF967_07660 [Methanosarcinales archaeon]|nr:hypothetical protein [Methanosarcinales archaeon]
MGFSVSSVVMLFFLSFIIILSGVYNGLYESHSNIQSAEVLQQELWISQRQTDIEIQSIDAINQTVVVKNIGEITLNTNKTTILMSGNYILHNSNPTGFWAPGLNATFNINQTIQLPLKIISENGISDIMR